MVNDRQIASSDAERAKGMMRKRAGVAWFAGVGIVGLALRAWLVYLAPGYAYLNDQVDFMVWSEWAHQFGPTSLYRLPGRTLVNTRLPRYMDAEGSVTSYPAFNAYNYPPLAGYLMWLQGWAWSATDRRGGFGVQRTFCRPRRTRLVGHLGGRISTSAGGS